MGAVGVDDDKYIFHGVESDAVEVAEEATGATHIVADGLILGLLQGVDSGDALKERVLASVVLFFKDMAPHIQPVTFLNGVM